MSKVQKYLTVILLSVLLILINGITVWKYPHGYTAKAESRATVIKELEKDETFDAWDYPQKADDYGIYVIQIAESASGNLYVYTYQPCQGTRELRATKINMSLTESATTTKVYELVFANASGVFVKYLVKGVKVSDEATRYYNVTSICRAWDREIDGWTGNNNTPEEKAYSVRQVYKVTTENGEKKYTRNKSYVVNILNPYVDYLLYTQTATYPMHGVSPIIPDVSKGFFVDAHYVAFSTDLEIERLLSATVHYEEHTADGVVKKFLDFDCGVNVTYGKRVDGYAYPKYDEKVEIESDRWGSKNKYSWNRIQTVSEFIAAEERLTEETKANLQKRQWVLRFLETERTQKKNSVLGYEQYDTHWTIIDRVAVLRLEFETDGVVYDLGAVSDVYSGDGSAGNVDKVTEKSVWNEIGDFFKNLFESIGKTPWWVWLIVVLVVLAVLLPLLSVFLPPFRRAVIFLIKLVWRIVTFPFLCLWWLIKKLFTKRESVSSSTSGASSKRTKAAKPTNTVGKTSKRSKAKKNCKK